MEIDATTEFGQRVLTHLAQDEVVWLTTVDEGGRPQPSPVWFLWQEGRLLIFSQPNTPKVRNISRNDQVALNFNCDASGGDVVIFNATAIVADDYPAADEMAAYRAKYAAGIARLGMDAERFAAAYSTVLRVTPSKLGGH